MYGQDHEGLSAYCVWLKRLLTQQWDIRRALPAAERARLLSEAERLLYAIACTEPAGALSLPQLWRSHGHGL